MPPKSKEHSASPVEKENPAEQKSLGRTVLRLVGGDSEPTSINIIALDHNRFVKVMAELALQGPFTMMDVFAAAGIPDSPINRADYEEQLPRFMREILAALGEDYSWEESQESAESAEPTTTEAELFTEAAQRVMSDKPGAGRLLLLPRLLKIFQTEVTDGEESGLAALILLRVKSWA